MGQEGQLYVCSRSDECPLNWPTADLGFVAGRKESTDSLRANRLSRKLKQAILC